MRSGTRGERLRLGGLDWSPARRTEQSCPPRTRAAPGSTNHPHRCLWDNAAHSRQAVELPGRAGAEPEAAPPPGCSAPRSSTIHSLQNGKHVSPRHRKRQALSLRVPARRSCLRRLTRRSSEGRAALPMEAEGHPDVSASPRRDSRCHVVWLSRNLCAVDKLLLRSSNSRRAGWLLSQTLFHYVPTEFNAAKK